MFAYLQQGGRAGVRLRSTCLHPQHGHPQDRQQPARRLAQPQGSRRYHKVFFYSRRTSYGWVISLPGRPPRLFHYSYCAQCAVRTSGHHPAQSKPNPQESRYKLVKWWRVMFDPAPSWSWVTGSRSGIPSIGPGSTTMSTQRSQPGSNQKNLVT